ncbi:unnamed protein product [Mytilus edulis]|uniref:Ig-like domain-containing protein n=1 Tax=Mytilus edulis TaxID=6550 RepID=A0A8S3QR35_MYTED|nr:unnamed protein product [Mytilus edulis]
MQTILINIIVFQLAVLHGDQTLQKKMYAKIGSEVILTCKISKETSTQSWRKHATQLTRGIEKNERFLGHERLEIINDRGFYNLKIYNITENDFSTYLCETQQGNSITTEETRLIHLVTSMTNPNADTTTGKLIDKHTYKEKAYIVPYDSSTSETKDDTGMHVGKRLFNGLFVTGFVLLCLSICANCFFDKLRAAFRRRKKNRSDDDEN